MEWMYLGMVVFLFLLATFDLFVGVSNDAVNFLNSAIGSRAARFRTLVVIASVGVFLGCVLSNGMMDIARHGIFSPQYFSFHDVMLIYLAVMVTDIVLLDAFNSFGMPTSTTVSMVFELLGASFAFVLLKMATDGLALGLGDYMNTSKALEVILGIFLSVPIAFVFGAIVQFLARLLFSFRITEGLRWKAGLFGGAALTAIIYFMLFKGLKNLSFMDAGVKEYLHEQIGFVLLCVFVGATVMMQVLHALKVNVFRVVVLCGTFALATAFAGNDLVNFIGVPLAGFSAWTDFTANGAAAGPDGFLMASLAESARTPLPFLFAAGAIMVVSLATSKKARKVVETEVGLSRKNEGEEMFGSSRMARSLVRWASTVGATAGRLVPERLARAVDARFQMPVEAQQDAAAYDMLRASVNLVMASLLIALGTSLKLPLSTTFVTFMVAMGSSLADRAWSRESAVFRITGVLTVIGGWFITAGVAFTACFFVATAMHLGGVPVVALIVAGAVYSIVHSQLRFARKQRAAEEGGDVLFRQMMTTPQRTAITAMLTRHLHRSAAERLDRFADLLTASTDALFAEQLRPLRKALRELDLSKRDLKNLRRREMLCLRRALPPIAGVQLSTSFHRTHNALRQMLYGIMRMAEPAREHVDNNFTPILPLYAERYAALRSQVAALYHETADHLRHDRTDAFQPLARQSKELQEKCRALAEAVVHDLQTKNPNLDATTLLLHLTQETEQLSAELRELLRALRAYHEMAGSPYAGAAE